MRPKLDAQTLATWFDAHIEFGVGPRHPRGRRQGRLRHRIGRALAPLRTVLPPRRSGLTNLARTTGGAQEQRFAGGSQQLAQGMADELGDRVVLGAPAEAVTHGPGGVVIGARLVDPGPDPADPSSAHRRLTCEPGGAVFAMSPALCGRLAYTPRSPGARPALPEDADGRGHQGPREFDAPFWRDDGLNGQIVAPGAAMSATFDNSPEDGSHGEIVGFIAGDECRRLEGARPRRAGSWCWPTSTRLRPRARRPSRWSSSAGRRAVHPRRTRRRQLPGALTALGPALRAPVGPLHWAGTRRPPSGAATSTARSPRASAPRTRCCAH